MNGTRESGHDIRIIDDGPDGHHWACLTCQTSGWYDANFDDGQPFCISTNRDVIKVVVDAAIEWYLHPAAFFPDERLKAAVQALIEAPLDREGEHCFDCASPDGTDV